jgi:hypothetical protein
VLAHGRWLSPGTPASSTTKTGCHDIAESGIKTPKNQSNSLVYHITSVSYQFQIQFFIGVDMVMCHALICIKEIHQSLT